MLGYCIVLKGWADLRWLRWNIGDCGVRIARVHWVSGLRVGGVTGKWKDTFAAINSGEVACGIHCIGGRRLGRLGIKIMRSGDFIGMG